MRTKKTNAAAAPGESHPPVLLNPDNAEEVFDLIADLALGPLREGADSCDATDLACFIHNEGETSERVEALLALAPIARRVYDRWDNAEFVADLQRRVAELSSKSKGRRSTMRHEVAPAAPAAVKGKKK